MLDPLIAAQAANVPNGNASALADNNQEAKEVQNARALQVLARVKEKLTGRDFKRPSSSNAPPTVVNTMRKQGVKSFSEKKTFPNGTVLGTETDRAMDASPLTTATAAASDEGYELPVDIQVEKLLAQATSVENLCQHYIGWCSFW